MTIAFVDQNTSYTAAVSMYDGSYIAYGQVFQGDGQRISSVKFYLSKAGSPTGNIYAKLYDITGTKGTTAVPTGSPLAISSAIDVSTLDTDFAEVEFTIQYQTVLGTNYAIVCEYDGGDADNRVDIRWYGGDIHHGNACRYDSSWVALASNDLWFKVIGEWLVIDSSLTSSNSDALYHDHIFDSYVTGQDASTQLYSGSYVAASQSITGNGLRLCIARWYAKKYGSPSGSIYCKVYNYTGTHGTDASPSGAALATSNAVNVADLDTSYDWVEFTFASPPTLSNGVHYCMTIEYDGGDSSNYLEVGSDDSSPAHGGNWAIYDTSWSTDSSKDFLFVAQGEYRTGDGQSFTGDGQKLTSVKFFLVKTGSPTGYAYAKLYAHSGTWGSSGVPGSLLATSNYKDVAEIAPSTDYYQWVTFVFPNPYTLEDGTHYIVTVEYESGNKDNKLSIRVDDTNPHAGNCCYRYMDVWVGYSGRDLPFICEAALGLTSPLPTFRPSLL